MHARLAQSSVAKKIFAWAAICVVLSGIAVQGLRSSLDANRNIATNAILKTDAPKYYHLNALLYKTPFASAAGNDVEPELARDKGDASEEGDDTSLSIDEMIEAMRRTSRPADSSREAEKGLPAPDKFGANESTGKTSEPKRQRKPTTIGDGAGRGTEASEKQEGSADADKEDNEVTAQSKSTDITDQFEDQQDVQSQADRAGSNTSLPAARLLRPPRNTASLRQKRRAGARHSPPRLTSRRSSARGSRRTVRWKIRHNPKPKRRV